MEHINLKLRMKAIEAFSSVVKNAIKDVLHEEGYDINECEFKRTTDGNESIVFNDQVLLTYKPAVVEKTETGSHIFKFEVI